MEKFSLGTKTRTLSSKKDEKLYSRSCFRIAKITHFDMLKILDAKYPWGNVVFEKTLALYLRLKLKL